MVLCPHISSEQWSPISLCHIWSDSQFVLHCRAPIKDDSTNTRKSTCSSFLAPLQQNDKASCPGKAHTCSAEPRRTTVCFCYTLRAGKVKLHCQLDFLHKMGAVCGQRITKALFVRTWTLQCTLIPPATPLHGHAM